MSSLHIRKALRCKIQTFSTNYHNDCRVYFKRDDSNKWHVPGITIGQVRKLIYIQYGRSYNRVSANSVIKAGEEFANTNLETVTTDISVDTSQKQKDTLL